MEFSLDAFFNSLISYLANGFPYMEDEELDRKKHPKRNPLHLQEAVFNNLPTVISNDQIVFDIGSNTLEEMHPYYHILEDSQVIRIRGKGTKTSKGSQDKITDRQARDYGRVNWNGKTFTQEYKKNVRGIRSKIGKSRQYFVDSDGQVFRINEKSNSYVNRHYHYIERILDNSLPLIAQEFNLKPLRVQDTGLQEEWNMQQQSDMGFVSSMNILDIINSFRED